MEVRERKTQVFNTAWPVTLECSVGNVEWLVKELWADMNDRPEGVAFEPFIAPGNSLRFSRGVASSKKVPDAELPFHVQLKAFLTATVNDRPDMVSSKCIWLPSRSAWRARPTTFPHSQFKVRTRGFTSLDDPRIIEEVELQHARAQHYISHGVKLPQTADSASESEH